MTWPGKDAPGHCMYCNQPLRGQGISGYCSFKCEKADDEAAEQKRNETQLTERVAPWKQ